MRRLRLVLLLFLLIFAVSTFSPASSGSAADNVECYTILVGKSATVDGSVLLAHNEDDRGELLVDWYIVPRIEHEDGEIVKLKKGAVLGQVPTTWSYLWLEIPGLDFSDSYMNEWGVVIASNQCRSREDSGEVEDGGIGYYFRRLVIERAKSSREAVHIAGKLIEKVGYSYSGRSYCIADPNEAWVLAVVQGKHWVARRVPDDEVAIVPNYYTIDYVDLSDTLNFLGSPDIVDYAVQRGWYSVDSGNEFNFRLAYSPCEVLTAIWNIPRHLGGINLLASNRYSYRSPLPFSFKPKKKVSLEDIMNVLAYHYEGTEFEMNPLFNNGNPHRCTISRICALTNRYGFVAQLRSSLPREIGNVMWLAPRRPCVQPFVPWYCGITGIPGSYTRGDFKKALETHFEAPENIREQCPEHAYWVFVDLAAAVDKNYSELIGDVKTWKWKYQKKLFDEQEKFEKKVLKTYGKDPEKARRMLTEYTSRIAEEVLKSTRKKLKAIETR